MNAIGSQCSSRKFAPDCLLSCRSVRLLFPLRSALLYLSSCLYFTRRYYRFSRLFVFSEVTTSKVATAEAFKNKEYIIPDPLRLRLNGTPPESRSARLAAALHGSTALFSLSLGPQNCVDFSGGRYRFISLSFFSPSARPRQLIWNTCRDQWARAPGISRSRRTLVACSIRAARLAFPINLGTRGRINFSPFLNLSTRCTFVNEHAAAWLV